MVLGTMPAGLLSLRELGCSAHPVLHGRTPLMHYLGEVYNIVGVSSTFLTMPYFEPAQPDRKMG